MAEAGRLDIRVSDEDIDERLGEMIENMGGADAFGRVLEKQNLTEALVRKSIEHGRKVDLLVDRIAEGLDDPTEDEISAHFEQHADEYSKPEQVQSRHILLKPESDSEADRATTRSRLLEIRCRVEEGADFAELAAAHSDCPSGRKTGGSLGWFSRGMMIPAFDEVVFNMVDGELSDVIETEAGMHLIHRTGYEESGPAAFLDVRDGIRDLLRHASRGEVITAYVEELKAKAVIEED